MTIIMLTLAFAIALGSAPTSQSTSQKISGYLVDTVCAKGHATEPGYVENHTRMCNLMDGCIKSGYTLVLSDKKMMELDSKGNELALGLSKSSRKDKDFKVTVTGSVTGSKIAVSAMALD